MKTTLTIAGAGLLLTVGSAAAQDIPATPPAQSPAPVQTAPVPPSEAPGTAREFSDTEIASFAAAALQIRALRNDQSLDEAARRAQAQTIVTSEGLDPRTYTAIGQAAQADPAIAQRVQLAIADLQEDTDS